MREITRVVVRWQWHCAQNSNCRGPIKLFANLVIHMVPTLPGVEGGLRTSSNNCIVSLFVGLTLYETLKLMPTLLQNRYVYVHYLVKLCPLQNLGLPNSIYTKLGGKAAYPYVDEILAALLKVYDQAVDGKYTKEMNNEVRRVLDKYEDHVTKEIDESAIMGRLNSIFGSSFKTVQELVVCKHRKKRFNDVFICRMSTQPASMRSM